MATRMAGRLRSLVPNRRGNVLMVFAGMLTAVLGGGALAVDTGMIYLKTRQLQGAADAAALAALTSRGAARAAVQAALTANGQNAARVSRIERGSYHPDQEIDPAARFVPGSDDANAYRVDVEYDVPLHFGWLLTGRRVTAVQASATAARLNVAAFSIGSRLASYDGGVANRLLSALAGTDLRLSVMDTQALASSDVGLLAFSSALRSNLALESASFGETLDSTADLPDIFHALAAATDSPGASAALQRLAVTAPGMTVRLSDLIDLGPLQGEMQAAGEEDIRIGSLAAVREILSLGAGDRQVGFDLGASASPLISAKAWLAIGNREAHSPWIAVSRAGEVTVRTAQARLYVDTSLVNLDTLTSVRLPILMELAQAKAVLSKVACQASGSPLGVTLDVTPSIGAARIADIDIAALDDFATSPVYRPAEIARTPLGPFEANASISLGGSAPQSVYFSAQDIASGTVKTASTNDAVASLVTSLSDDAEIRPRVAGYSVLIQPLTGSLRQGLVNAAPSVDRLVNQITDMLGLGLGEADVRVNAIRCGTPALVG